MREREREKERRESLCLKKRGERARNDIGRERE